MAAQIIEFTKQLKLEEGKDYSMPPIEDFIGKEAAKRLMPEGYNPEIWEIAVDSINIAIGIELDTAQEQKRNPDAGFVLAAAAYEGFINGIGAVTRYLYGIPGCEGVMLSKLITSSEELKQPF